jgi:hypothetical protein
MRELYGRSPIATLPFWHWFNTLPWDSPERRAFNRMWFNLSRQDQGLPQEEDTSGDASLPRK